MTEKKYGKKNIIKVDPLAYNLGLIGLSGIGKTTLAKQVCEQLVGQDGYMVFTIGKEDGHDAIAGIVYEEVPDWDTFEDITNHIIENRLTIYKDLKVIVYDTIDELFEIATPRVIELNNKEFPDKQVKSLNQAYTGFGKGEQKAIEIVLDKMWELKRLGISMFVIGHTKKRTMNDVSTGLDYDMVTTNMQHNYFNAIKTKLHVLGVATIDREITQVKTGKKFLKGKDKGKEITKGSVTNESRIITFRDDNFNIDSKSRFAEIVDEIEFNPSNFIEAVKEAIKLEHEKQSGVKSIEETRVNQDTEKENKIEESVKLKQVDLDARELDGIIEQLTEFVKTNKLTPQNTKPLITKSKEFGLFNPLKVTDLKQAKALLALIQ